MQRRTFLALPLAAAARGADKPLDLGGVVEKHVMVPMRDGVRLSTWLYLPPGDGPWPVIYEQRYAPIRADRTRLESADFARRGYGCNAELPRRAGFRRDLSPTAPSASANRRTAPTPSPGS
ncbi:MAG: hypothetical protein R2724_29545 [Bryobacterales bacterium]